ncbi:MAG: TonB-dependent receptor [Paracoccus sp. (in: a-proteobacteria)]|uniref:TonB-dependent receptor n=1 Tax=Paracoccus sp. TaxID=267 RepID=UPI0026E10FE3|nr:TonB-dependent receptor [Paracoccus sp. (in: a-proteobacteria)]MDO5614040.1 TonB-dependent receptor [Paracoccus sp. (in: a-proteobacteria)]
MPRFQTSCLFLLGATVSVSTPVSAQTILEEITLIGTGLPTEVWNNPASITVLSQDTLREQVPVSVAELLRDVPGVQVSEEGAERIAIRGETARRVAILIDGQKLTDHTNYGQPILIDPTTIERIEVVRGSSSVVSGSRAIGGVINIITKRGADVPLQVDLSGGYLSATDGHRLSATVSGRRAAGAGEIDYRLSWGRMEQGNRQTPLGELAQSDMSDRNLSAHLGYRQGAHYMGLKAQSYDLAANVYTGDPEFLIGIPDRDLRKVSAFYEGTDLAPWLTRLSADVYGQRVDRLFENDVTTAAGPSRVNVVSTSDDRQETWGLNLRAEMRLTPNSRSVVGLEYEDDQLASDKLSRFTITPPGMTTTTIRWDEAQIRTLSVFGQHEIDLTDQVAATFGARWYDVDAQHLASTTNGVTNPTSRNGDSLALASAGVVYTPSERVALRANLSQGYIYPTLGQLFLTTTGGGLTLTGNPDLLPETSTTFELGARYDDGATMIDATLFHTNAKDYIATISDGRTGTYQNVNRAKSWGLELHAEHQHAGSGLTPYASVAVLKRELTYSNGFTTADSGSPEVSGRLGVRTTWQHGSIDGTFDLFLRGESGVRMRDDSAALIGSSGGYATLNMRGRVNFGNGLSLVAEVNNLTDRAYEPYGQMPGAGRSANLFLTKRF